MLLPALVVCNLTTPAPTDNCHATFVEYHPSTLEQKWLDHIDEWQDTVCEHTPDTDINSWLKATEDFTNHVGAKCLETADQTVTQQQLPWGDFLSTFTYRRTCVSPGNEPMVSFVHIPIEPTASICRDPRKCWSQMTEKYTQSKEYLVALSAQAYQKIPPVSGSSSPKAFLFDAGATIPVKSTEHLFKWTGTDWIYSHYQNLGVTFDSVYAWEPAKGWKQKQSGKGGKKKPRAMVQKEINYTFFPEGVLHFRPVGISTEPGDRENPLAEIKRVCKPEDFVVFKLDIDSRYEIEVVRTIMGDPELLALIDDFYYEHHVRNYVMRMHGLSNSSNPDPLYTLKGWYDIVTPARRGGLRMHFWP